MIGFGNPGEIAGAAESIRQEDRTARLRAFLNVIEAKQKQQRLEETAWKIAVDQSESNAAQALCDQEFVLAGLSEIFHAAAPETIIRGDYSDRFGRTIGMVVMLGGSAFGSLLLQEAGDALNASSHIFSEATGRPLRLTDPQADINGPLPDPGDLTLEYAQQLIGDSIPKMGSWLDVAFDLEKITSFSCESFSENRAQFINRKG